MANFKWLIDGFTWSHSRLTTFTDCPYKFYLKYIVEVPSSQKFFAQYGSYMHLIHQMFYNGELEFSELPSFYLANFPRCVYAPSPTVKILEGYMRDGLSYWKSFKPTEDKIIAVEKYLEWECDGKKYRGIIDLITQDANGEYKIVDHKSKKLKPYSGRATPTKSDLDLSEAFKQLHMYALPATLFLGAEPKTVEFNSFQIGHRISEATSPKAQGAVYSWAEGLIRDIPDTETWYPTPDQWKCRHICDVSKECEYCKMNFG